MEITKNKAQWGALLAAMVCLSSVAEAFEETNWNFSGSANGGTGSAEMTIKIDGNSLELKLDNTSPTELDTPDFTNENAPGIVGFGFNVSGTPSVTSWELKAFDKFNAELTIGGSSVVSGDWVMGTTLPDDVQLDYLPQSDVEGVKGALYNPAAIGSPALAALPNYFTQATLTMQFSTTPVLASEVCKGSGGGAIECTTYVRMQNVGNGGSLKLFGEEDGNGNGPGVPEPSVLALSGLGLMGIGFVRRRRERCA